MIPERSGRGGLSDKNQATFFMFHRYYLWTYEQLLHDECGYEGMTSSHIPPNKYLMTDRHSALLGMGLRHRKCRRKPSL